MYIKEEVWEDYAENLKTFSNVKELFFENK